VNQPCRTIRPDLEGRVIRDGVTTKDSTTIRSDTAAFVQTDKFKKILVQDPAVGKWIFGPDATITDVAPDGKSAVVSKRADSTGANLYVNIGGGVRNPAGAGVVLVGCPSSATAQEVRFGGSAIYNAGGFSVPVPGSKVKIEGIINQANSAPNNYCARDQAEAAANGNNPSAGGSWTCVAPSDHDPKPKVVVPADIAPAKTSVTCNDLAGRRQTVYYFFPGFYPASRDVKSEMDKGAIAYFASGVYYFNRYTVVEASAAYGGEPASATERLVPTPGGPCDGALTDNAADAACRKVAGCQYKSRYADVGKGVTFILGGQSVFDIHAPTTELFRRVAGTQEAACPGGIPQKCSGVTVFAYASTPASSQVAGSYNPFTGGLSDDRCNCAFVTDESGQQIIFHGLTYAPYSPVDIFSNKGSAQGRDYSPFFGGVVASVIVARVDADSLGSSLFAGGSGAGGGPSIRTVLIKSNAPGSNGSASITSSAVVTIDVNQNKTTVVESWRNQ
jgi:hypothetical protein